MDIIYNIQQIGNNRILLNDEISSFTFTCVLKNPWTNEEKTATIAGVGRSEEFVLNFIGVSEPYEDLASGQIYFDNEGTWQCNIIGLRVIDLQVRSSEG